jgi:hypothetical protein
VQLQKGVGRQVWGSAPIGACVVASKGSFSRITEVATRIAGQLPSEAVDD